jgi:hypothetical protein
MRPRNRELIGLIPASILLTAGFAGVFIQHSSALSKLSDVSLTYGAIFLGLCLAGHLVIRFTLPHADPYLFPLAAALASCGIVEVYRIDPTAARRQAVWFVIGLILFAATIIFLRDYRKLERYHSPCSSCPACRGSASRSTGPISGSTSRASGCSSRPSSPRSVWSSSWPATCATLARSWSWARGVSSGSRSRRSSTSVRCW